MPDLDYGVHLIPLILQQMSEAVERRADVEPAKFTMHGVNNGPYPRLGMAADDLEAYRAHSISMLCSAGLSGLPQVSMPIAEVDGLPFGISVLGPKDADLALLALCRKAIAGTASHDETHM